MKRQAAPRLVCRVNRGGVWRRVRVDERAEKTWASCAALRGPCVRRLWRGGGGAGVAVRLERGALRAVGHPRYAGPVLARHRRVGCTCSRAPRRTARASAPIFTNCSASARWCTRAPRTLTRRRGTTGSGSASVFTRDGAHVEALGHAEYHGHRHGGACAADDYMSCWRNAIVALESDDGGRSFTRVPGPPVAALPYRYDRTQTRRSGYFNPSNMLVAGGYLHVFFFSEAYGAQRRGVCLARRPLDGGPGDWRAWDGHGFHHPLRRPLRVARRRAGAPCLHAAAGPDRDAHIRRPAAGHRTLPRRFADAGRERRAPHRRHLGLHLDGPDPLAQPAYCSFRCRCSGRGTARNASCMPIPPSSTPTAGRGLSRRWARPSGSPWSAWRSTRTARWDRSATWCASMSAGQRKRTLLQPCKCRGQIGKLLAGQDRPLERRELSDATWSSITSSARSISFIGASNRS